MKASVALALRSGASIENAVATARPDLAKLLLARLPLASDAALLEYHTVYLEGLRRLEKLDAHRCYQFGVWGQDVQPDETPDLLTRRLKAVAEVFRTSREAPVSTFDAVRAKTLLRDDWNQAIAEGADFSRLTEHGVTPEDEQRLCHAVVAFQGAIARGTPSDAALAFRYSLSH